MSNSTEGYAVPAFNMQLMVPFLRPCRIVLVGLVMSLTACVDTFSPALQLNTNLLIVEGTLTDLPVKQTIILSRSRSTADSNITTPIAKAQVQVLVNGTIPFSLSETQSGRYELPAAFQGRVGDSYQLRFTLADGTRYESNTETMVGVPPIQRVYDQFNPNGPPRFADGLPTPDSDVYVDFQDPPGQRNFYLWRTRLYERQAWCASCQQGRYKVADVGPVGAGPINVIGCVHDNTLGIYNFFDYTCRDDCWDIFYSNTLNIFADSYTNGQAQSGRLVAQVPVYQKDPALLDIEQLSLTAGAYRYYKLFQDQTQNTGTLVDTPPSPISGNVHNVANGEENVVGYFSASSVSLNHYWLDRLNVTSGRFRGLFYAETGRQPNVEIPASGSGYGVGIPSAICIPSPTRTNVQPMGWR